MAWWEDVRPRGGVVTRAVGRIVHLTLFRLTARLQVRAWPTHEETFTFGEPQIQSALVASDSA